MSDRGFCFGELLKITLTSLNIQYKDLLYLMDTEYALDPSIVSKWVKGVAKPTRKHYNHIVDALCNKTKELSVRGYKDMLNKLVTRITEYVEISNLPDDAKVSLLKYDEIDILLREIYDAAYFIKFDITKSNKVLLNESDEITSLSINSYLVDSDIIEGEVTNEKTNDINNYLCSENIEILPFKEEQEQKSFIYRHIFNFIGSYKRKKYNDITLVILFLLGIGIFTTQYGKLSAVQNNENNSVNKPIYNKLKENSKDKSNIISSIEKKSVNSQKSAAKDSGINVYNNKNETFDCNDTSYGENKKPQESLSIDQKKAVINRQLNPGGKDKERNDSYKQQKNDSYNNASNKNADNVKENKYVKFNINVNGNKNNSVQTFNSKEENVGEEKDVQFNINVNGDKNNSIQSFNSYVDIN